MNVVVIGFYHKENLGDQLFIEAFRALFPHITFKFCDVLTIENIKGASAVFFGGGSFLSSDVNASQECLNLIRTLPIFYVGVGAETSISASNRILMGLARLIAIRSPVGLDKVKEINDNVIIIPDLVYALTPTIKTKRHTKSVLILPNIYVVPKNTDEHWKHCSWEHFKFEFSQFIDHLVESGYTINFAAMCKNNKENDENAAIEIINCMRYRDSKYIINIPQSSQDIFRMLSEYAVIITQRFHGVVLAEMMRIPSVIISHHDKLKSSYLNEGELISYYAASKQTFIDKFYSTTKIKLEPSLLLKTNMYDELKEKINSLLSED